MSGVFKYSGVRKSHQSLNEVYFFNIKDAAKDQAKDQFEKERKEATENQNEEK